MRYGVIEMKLQMFFPQKLKVLKTKVAYQGIKNGPIGKSSAPVGDIPWYEYKCLLCTICGGNDEN